MKSLQNHLSAQNYFKTVQDNFSQELQTSTLVLDPIDLYVAADVSGIQGQKRILDSNSVNEVGLCSFDPDGKMNTGRAVIFDKLVLKVGTATAGDHPATVEYNKAMPLAVQNSKITFKQRGKVVLEALGASLDSEAAPQTPQDNFRQLDSPRFFVDNVGIEIEIETPPGVAIPTGTFIKPWIQGLVSRHI